MMCCYNPDIDETMSRMAVMRRQEETTYIKLDYFGNKSGSATPMVDSNPLAEPTDETCRSAMLIWCSQVIESCNFSKETLEIVMSCIDRFMHTSIGRETAATDRSVYQLVCMTALYTCVKINEPTAIDPKFVSMLSRYVYSTDDVEAMERTMLSALQWRVNPPTSLSFTRMMLSMIPNELLDASVRQKVHELVQKQSFEIMKQYSFVQVHASTIAYCALMNAIDMHVDDYKVLSAIRSILNTAISSNVLSVQAETMEYNRLIQSYLYNTVIAPQTKSLQEECTTTPTTPKREVVRTKSPHCVAALQSNYV